MKTQSSWRRSSNGATRTALAAAIAVGTVAGGFTAFGSGDYGPAIWNPACSGHWYTSGFGHKFHVCHDMEGYYLTTISYFKNCNTSASVHYCINGKQDAGSDAPAGEITQMVAESNYAWHVLCWNQYCTGTEHEGFASNPSWYTDAMYESSGPLARHEAQKFGYVIDRNHIVGHNAWQNSVWHSWASGAFGINTSCNTHTDPGPYWNWNHMMALTIYELGGAIQAKYNALGGQNCFLGEPTTSETGTPDGVGRFNHFNNGSIYWTPNFGAWSIGGAIQSHWASLGWETSPVGYPVTDETGTPDGVGRYNHFKTLAGDSGSIYWTPNYGAWSIHGAIRDKWASLGWETSVVGYPVTDESPANGGRYNHFETLSGTHGSIYYSAATGAHEVHGAIRDLWASLGWENSCLGFPTSDEYAYGSGRRNDFQGGYITYDSVNGAVSNCTNSAPPPPKIDVIVDNSDAGFSASANWSTGTSSTDKLGADYRFRSTAALSDEATWSVNLTNSGTYVISARWTQGSNRSATAPYVVTDTAGSHTVNMNQQANGGTWMSLGTYTLNAGTNTVKLSCWTTTGFVVVADAIRWQQQ